MSESKMGRSSLIGLARDEAQAKYGSAIGKRRDAIGVSSDTDGTGLQLLNEAAEVGKFTRAIHRRMTSQNLLDQGSP